MHGQTVLAGPWLIAVTSFGADRARAQGSGSTPAFTVFDQIGFETESPQNPPQSTTGGNLDIRQIIDSKSIVRSAGPAGDICNTDTFLPLSRAIASAEDAE
jgi:hypothetical protein